MQNHHGHLYRREEWVAPHVHRVFQLMHLEACPGRPGMRITQYNPPEASPRGGCAAARRTSSHPLGENLIEIIVPVVSVAGACWGGGERRWSLRSPSPALFSYG
ncbi:hypothetical protein PABG_07366 [Paracoccidioides brasiliensis Pb03]|nr:hypothetical protein PABG_07366 [Paracoccidioides brasiliensis Pb03]